MSIGVRRAGNKSVWNTGEDAAQLGTALVPFCKLGGWDGIDPCASFGSNARGLVAYQGGKGTHRLHNAMERWSKACTTTLRTKLQ